VKAVRMVQAQPIMGWGVDNPEPSPGQYDFESLDRRMDFIRRSGGIPVITLCCAPDWMKGGQPGATDWGRLTAAPFPEHFADFAALSVTIAKRYPYVRHFVVWNEFKGFFDESLNRWDAVKYTEFYNVVYDALKAVDPRIQVGGPYLDFDSRPAGSHDSSPYLQGSWGAIDQRVLDAFIYWKLGRRGADFVVVDGHATTSAGAPDEFTALDKFTVVGTWLRQQVVEPIWWSEWYTEPDGADWSPQHKVALRVAAMIHLAGTAADTILYWNPRPDDTRCASCLWTDTTAADGGQPLPFLTDQLQRFARFFPPSVDRWSVHLGDRVVALASPRALVMVNTANEIRTASVGGRHIELAPYETRWLTAQAQSPAGWPMPA
jgi:hypothetical protein